jgi:hypothetical protein
MAYLGNSPVLSQQEYRNIDNISGSFNGVTTSFPLLVNGVAPVPAPQSSNQCLISVNGVVQKPDDTGASGFRLSGGNIVFSAAPTGGQSFFGVILAGADYIYAGSNFPDGTVSAPSITFAQDLDTGFYRSGAGEVKFTANGTNVVTLSANNLTAPSFIPTSSTVPSNGVYLPSSNNVAISTNGTGRLYVDASGNVGVGAAPAVPLDIQQAQATQRLYSTTGTNTSHIQFRNTGGIAYVGLDSSTGGSFGAAYGLSLTHTGAYPITFVTNGLERMRLDSSGRLGLGTGSPGALLTLAASVPEMRLVDSDNSLYGTITAPGGDIYIDADKSNGAGGSIIRFAVDDVERARIDSSGRLGIGTTPSAQLDVVSSSTVLRLATAAAQSHILFRDTTNSKDGYLNYDNGAFVFFRNGPSESFRCDNAGRFLVGTSSTLINSDAIQIAADSTNCLGLLSGRGDVYGPRIDFAKSRGTTISPSNVTNGDQLANFSFAGYHGSYVEGVKIEAYVDGTPGANDMPGRLVFSTTADGSNSPTERMRIDSNGDVTLSMAPIAGITNAGGNKLIFRGLQQNGQSNSMASIYGIGGSSWGGNLIFTTKLEDGNPGSSPTERMRIQSNGRVLIGGTVDVGAYDLQVKATGVWGFGAYVNGSDRSIKEDIEPLASSIEIVKRLNPVSFRYKEDFTKDTALQPGFVAQDLQQAFAGQPYLDGIVQAGPEFLSVAYQSLIPVLTKALQEAVAKIETLEAEVAALKGA